MQLAHASKGASPVSVLGKRCISSAGMPNYGNFAPRPLSWAAHNGNMYKNTRVKVLPPLWSLRHSQSPPESE